MTKIDEFVRKSAQWPKLLPISLHNLFLVLPDRPLTEGWPFITLRQKRTTGGSSVAHKRWSEWPSVQTGSALRCGTGQASYGSQ